MKYIPIFQIIATLTLAFYEMDNLLYVFLSNILGYSLFSSIFFAYYLKGETEKHIKIAPYFLILINIFNIIGLFIDYQLYEKSFILLITIIYTIIAFYGTPENR